MDSPHLALLCASARYTGVWRGRKMFIHRLLLSLLFGSLTIAVVRADNAVAAPAAEKSKPAVPPEHGITFDWVHVDGPYIAMTFDDGPSAKLTPKLLDLLAAHHIKVTFFLIGENVAENPEIAAREVREGHEVANHSWSHPNLGKMSDDGVRAQLRRTDDAIRSASESCDRECKTVVGSVASSG